MKLSKREEDLLRRGLDKATTADEAETAAKNFFKELRRRGVDGYQFVPTEPVVAPAPPPEWTPPPPTYTRSAPTASPTATKTNPGNGVGCLIFLVIIVFCHNFWLALFLMWLVPRLIFSKSFRVSGAILSGLVALSLFVWIISALPKAPSVPFDSSYPTATPTPYTPAPTPTPYPTPYPTPTPYPMEMPESTPIPTSIPSSTGSHEPLYDSRTGHYRDPLDVFPTPSAVHRHRRTH